MTETPIETWLHRHKRRFRLSSFLLAPLFLSPVFLSFFMFHHRIGVQIVTVGAVYTLVFLVIWNKQLRGADVDGPESSILSSMTHGAIVGGLFGTLLVLPLAVRVVIGHLQERGIDIALLGLLQQLLTLALYALLFVFVGLATGALYGVYKHRKKIGAP